MENFVVYGPIIVLVLLVGQLGIMIWFIVRDGVLGGDLRKVRRVICGGKD